MITTEMERVSSESWRPPYVRTEVIDVLHEAFEDRADYAITPEASMKEIIRKTRRRQANITLQLGKHLN